MLQFIYSKGEKNLSNTIDRNIERFFFSFHLYHTLYDIEQPFITEALQNPNGKAVSMLLHIKFYKMLGRFRQVIPFHAAVSL